MSFLFQKVGRSRAEIFKILKNGSASAIGPGNAVCYDYTTAADGLAVILPTTALLNMFAGLVAAGTTLAASGSDGQYGKVLVHGHHASARWSGTSTPPGAPLVPVNATGAMAAGATHVTSINTANSEIQFAYTGESSTHVTSLSSTAKVAFVRAL